MIPSKIIDIVKPIFSTKNEELLIYFFIFRADDDFAAIKKVCLCGTSNGCYIQNV